MKKNVLRNEKGFTLIEIIAVLIILGILAAVAVPKYIDLAAKAEQKTVMATRAELQSRATQWFASKLIAGNGTVTPAGGTTLAANIGAVPAQNEFPDWTIVDATGLTAKTDTGVFTKAHTITVAAAMSATSPAQITFAIIP